MSGVNVIFKPIEDIRKNVNGLMAELLDGLDGRIVGADLCMLGAIEDVTEALRMHNPDVDVRIVNEPSVGIAAALQTCGAVALSGTGSDAFFVRDTESVSVVGGWGPLLGDEGSGYDIGLSALHAAIYSYDGRKEKTKIYDLLMERWELTDLWDIVTKLAKNPDYRHEVASVAAICSAAARAGDRVALEIYKKAAYELFLAIRVVIDQHFDEWDATVVIMGGAWKGHEIMLDTFSSLVKNEFPSAVIHRPIFEPVIGCAVLRALQEGRSIDSIREPMKKGFSEFLYK